MSARAPSASAGWPVWGLEDDVRPRMDAAAARGEAFALATIVAADGGPRPLGAQMVVTQTEQFGFLSGGCIEDDVAANGRAVLDTGQPRRLVYGRGSPFIDIRLPCGGRIEVAVECVMPGDPALVDLTRLTAQRRPAVWRSDGLRRSCHDAGATCMDGDLPAIKDYSPGQQLVVVGTDPFALAIAAVGHGAGWETRLLAPFGPQAPAPGGVPHDTRPLGQALADLTLDQWTAVAVATHDLDADHEALVPVLQSRAGFVGVLGSRRKLGERCARLLAAGLSAEEVERLRAPIGLAIGARSPWEVAIAVTGEIIAHRKAFADAQNEPTLVHAG